MVGATVKDPSAFSPDLVADEKHSRWLGKRIYIAVTAAKECFLGVGVAHSADETELTQAYGEFQQEALALNPDYCPDTVNTDGWDATQQAWKALFPGITLMLCFLHTVLGIQQHCRRDKVLHKPVTDKLWGLFHAMNPRQFGQRLRRLQEWAITHVSHEIVLKKLLALNSKATQFKLTQENLAKVFGIQAIITETAVGLMICSIASCTSEREHQGATR